MASAELHTWGRSVLEAAWPLVHPGSSPTTAELQIAGAVADLETSYGKGWKGPGAGSNNWGAIICTNKLKAGEDGCLPGCFPNLDSSPGNPLEMRCFREYPSPEEGASHLIKLITVKRPLSHEAMRAGDIDAFSANMHATHYYEGTSLDPAVNIDRHATAVWIRVQAIAAALGEPLAAQRGGPMNGGGGGGEGDQGGGGGESPSTPLGGLVTLCAGAGIAWGLWKLLGGR